MSETTYTEEETKESSILADEDCFGEYGRTPYCKDCPVAKRCKRFTDAEKEVSLRYGGKYKGRGKEKRRDRY